MLTEESPVGSSASNGVVERGILTAEGQIRVLKDALEKKIKCVLASDHPILAMARRIRGGAGQPVRGWT